MCNASNHSPQCDCGFGGGNYGTHSYGNSLSSSLQNEINCDCNSNIKKNAEAETFLVSCPWCGEEVFYHSNGCGDSVYFDSLGYPWPVHECFKKYWEDRKTSLKMDLNTSQINVELTSTIHRVPITTHRVLITTYTL